MTIFQNSIAKSSFAVMLVICIFSTMISTKARAGDGNVDVFVVYSGKDRKEKSALKKALLGNLVVKFYNADLLEVADYSGKQKAIAKLEKAKVIVVLKDRPMELFEGTTFARNVLIVNSAKNSVKSENWTLYVVGKGTDLSALGGNLRPHNAASVEDLNDLEALRGADVVLVDEAALDIHNAVGMIVSKVLGS